MAKKPKGLTFVSRQIKNKPPEKISQKKAAKMLSDKFAYGQRMLKKTAEARANKRKNAAKPSKPAKPGHHWRQHHKAGWIQARNPGTVASKPASKPAAKAKQVDGFRLGASAGSFKYGSKEHVASLTKLAGNKTKAGAANAKAAKKHLGIIKKLNKHLAAYRSLPATAKPARHIHKGAIASLRKKAKSI